MHQGRPIEYPTERMLAALEASQTIQAAADILGCSAPAIQARAKQDLSVRRAMREQRERLEAEMATAILKRRGILSRVAEDLGFRSAQAVNYHIRQSPLLQQAVEEARYRVVDWAEGNVFEKVEEGDYGASVFVLKNLGKDRGYTERKEVEQHTVHSLDEASTATLVQMLDQLAATAPESVEAEFEVMEDEDREMLQAVLADVAGDAEDVRELPEGVVAKAEDVVAEKEAAG